MLSVPKAGRAAAIRTSRRSVPLAMLLGVAAFGLFGLTAGGFAGYENETAAVSEGLVKVGAPRILEGSRLAVGFFGRDGIRYGRTGLTQPVLEAPLYWLGEKLDEISSDGRR